MYKENQLGLLGTPLKRISKHNLEPNNNDNRKEGSFSERVFCLSCPDNATVIANTNEITLPRIDCLDMYANKLHVSQRVVKQQNEVQTTLNYSLQHNTHLLANLLRTLERDVAKVLC